MAEADLHHFRTISWCAKILSDPNIRITPTFSRQYKSEEAGAEDSLYSTTLQTPSTISHILSFHPPPISLSDPALDASIDWVPELCQLVTLGIGMNGGAAMLHGGIITTLMDDCVGTLLTVNQTQQTGLPLTADTFTATMNIKFLRPVKTPSTLLVVARSREWPTSKTRKYILESEIQDENGTVLAKSDSLWIRPVKKEDAKL